MNIDMRLPPIIFKLSDEQANQYVIEDESCKLPTEDEYVINDDSPECELIRESQYAPFLSNSSDSPQLIPPGRQGSFRLMLRKLPLLQIKHQHIDEYDVLAFAVFTFRWFVLETRRQSAY